MGARDRIPWGRGQWAELPSLWDPHPVSGLAFEQPPTPAHGSLSAPESPALLRQEACDRKGALLLPSLQSPPNWTGHSSSGHLCPPSAQGRWSCVPSYRSSVPGGNAPRPVSANQTSQPAPHPTPPPEPAGLCGLWSSPSEAVFPPGQFCPASLEVLIYAAGSRANLGV